MLEVFENTSDSVFVVQAEADGRFRIEDVNESQARLLRKARDGLQGRFIDELVPAAIATEICENYRRCLQS
ncbi:MAG: PAS domain-containing protein, partial [Leptospiraceae bacterium]|nr:PAS domain-containing protein [Leptospiraceae bacterium]